MIMAQGTVRVLGVDPGSAATGWAIVSVAGNRYTMHGAGVIRPRGSERASRLADLGRKLNSVIVDSQPDESAVETPFSGRNPRSAIVLAEARGVILSVLGTVGLSVADYSPAEVKSAIVGNGRAEKDQVVFMVTRLLGLSVAPAKDAADAMAIALTHLHRRRWPGQQ